MDLQLLLILPSDTAYQRDNEYIHYDENCHANDDDYMSYASTFLFPHFRFIVSNSREIVEVALLHVWLGFIV